VFSQPDGMKSKANYRGAGAGESRVMCPG